MIPEKSGLKIISPVSIIVSKVSLDHLQPFSGAFITLPLGAIMS